MRRAAVTLLALLTLAAPAQAFRLARDLAPIRGNPANALAGNPIEVPAYDPATHCDKRPKPGVVALRRWLQRHAQGVFWGSYRCERWGKHSASLHAENRAIDWHLDASSAADRRAARWLIELLLAPDQAGNAQALARRMGVEEIIWDCSYWSSGMPEFRRYSACFSRSGKPRRRVDRTTAHRDHIHFGMSKAGAAGRTSFWRVRR